MVKVHIVSDLHMEFGRHPHEVPPEADLVVCAGDMGNGKQGIDDARSIFRNQKTFYVTGNHDYYNEDMALFNPDVQDEKFYSTSKGHRFYPDLDIHVIGTTLWTNFELSSNKFLNMRNAQLGMSDYGLIKYRGNSLRPNDTYELYKEHSAWIKKKLVRHPLERTIVVTHHLPSAKSVSPRFFNSPLNPAFASTFLEDNPDIRPALWIHGHTHDSCDYVMDGTRVVCNPRGYPRKSGDFENPWFRPGLVIEIGE